LKQKCNHIVVHFALCTALLMAKALCDEIRKPVCYDIVHCRITATVNYSTVLF